MDADDISLPERLEKQFNYMEAHPDVVMCGCWLVDFGGKTAIRKIDIGDMDHYRIKMLFDYPGPWHPTVFLRHETLIKYSIEYDEELPYAEDYALYAELGNLGKVEIVQDVLLRHRIHPKRVTKECFDLQKQRTLMTHKKLLLRILDDVTDEEVELHYHYSHEMIFSGIPDAAKCFRWYLKLVCANNRVGEYPKKKFMSYVCKLFMIITLQSFMPKAASAISAVRNRIKYR